MAELAEKIDEHIWAKSFLRPALAILQNDDLSVQYRLESAYDCTNVFWGMGSWNDTSPYSAYLHQQTQQYEHLTDKLWNCRQAVMRLRHPHLPIKNVMNKIFYFIVCSVSFTNSSINR